MEVEEEKEEDVQCTTVYFYPIVFNLPILVDSYAYTGLLRHTNSFLFFALQFRTILCKLIQLLIRLVYPGPVQLPFHYLILVSF